MKSLTIGPRYGRDYSNKADAEKAFREGLDFTSYSMDWYGAAVSIRECVSMGITGISLRYSKLQKVHVFEI